MYGNAGQSKVGNFIVIKQGNLWHWMNQATGHVSNVGYETYEQADKEADEFRQGVSKSAD